MYAFTTPLPASLSTTFTGCPPTTRSPTRPCLPLHRPRGPPVTLRASADPPDFGAAVSSGEPLRRELDELARSRKAQAEVTEKKLKEMSDQLSKIVAKLRADAGMPPVAEPPSDDAPPSAQTTARIPDPVDDSAAASDEPYMDPSNFGYESTAGWQVLSATDELPENESGNVEFRIECDMNGCSIIEVKGDAPPGPGVRQRFIQSGPGFRVGYDPEAPKGFCGMLGNDQWLLALNYDEIRHFKRLCLSLQKKMDRIGRGEEEPPMKKPAVRRSGDGMFNMRIARAGLDCSVELESKLVWVQAIGQPVVGQYCIRAIFMEGRQSEGFWAPDTVPNMLASLHKLGIE